MAKSLSSNNQRRELDVDFTFVFIIALAIAVLIYVAALLVRDSFIYKLLYERGLTQYIVVFLASMVISFVLLKLNTLLREVNNLNHKPIPDNFSFENPNSDELITLWKKLVNDRSLISKRCSRVIAAYINSGDRKAATELALDDSAFYQSATDTSYAFPRILVWAIPLLGFIGTVLGISNAVNGFSGFLESAAEIDTIKQGIGEVTSGLGVAFDTTLLALALSVVVMIPLVLIERFESRLLLAIDVYLNDRVLPRLNDKDSNNILDGNNLSRTIRQTIQDNLPTPEHLIEPAKELAREAATQIAEGFIREISAFQDESSKIFEQMNKFNKMTLADRQEFITSFDEQQQAHKQVVKEISELVTDIKETNAKINNGLTLQANQISEELTKAAQILETRIISLEKNTTQISQIPQLKKSLEKIVNSLERTAELESTLKEVRENLIQLQPALEKIGQPRRLTLVEKLDPSPDSEDNSIFL